MRIKNVVKKGLGLVLGAALLPAVGCGPQGVDLAGIIPEDRQVSINVPGGGDGQAVLGERSDFYETTYNISRGINGGVGFVLGLARAISRQQPTSVEGNTYVWGPSEPNGLERISWRFTGVKIDENHWTFKLDGREKGKTAESDFKTVFDGDVTRTQTGPARGHGTLNLYFDNSQALEQKSCGNGNRDVLTGQAAVQFASDTDPKSVKVDFTGFHNECDANNQGRTAATYLYTEAADGSGNFQFSANGNIHRANENKPEIETMTIRSRWQADGQGRSDVSVTGGEVPGDLQSINVPGNSVIATECWDENFNVVFQTTEPTELPQQLRDSIRPTEGDAAACVYTDTQLADAI